MMSNTTDVRNDDLVIAAPRKEIVFIEDNVPDMTTLIGSMGADKEVVILDSSKDGLQQIMDALAGRSGIDALHIISHGAAGSLNLGALTLNAETLNAHGAELQAIGASLNPDADILLYGCGVGAGPGAGFVDQLALATGADVAASNDLTGNVAAGGDWDLEVTSGTVETGVAVDAALAAHYAGVLNFTPASPVGFSDDSRFVDRGYESGNVIYRLDDSGKYQLVIDGQKSVFATYGQIGTYASLSVYNNDPAVNVAFQDGQVFTISSLKVSGQSVIGGDQELILTGTKLNGDHVQTRVVEHNDYEFYATLDMSEFTDIVKLTITTADNGGVLKYVALDDLVISNVHAAVADTTPPTLTISSDVPFLKAGQTAAITFTFSEDPGASFTKSDVTVSGGTIGELTGSGLTRSAVFTPDSGVDNGTASITVAAGAYTDAAGNPGGAGASPSLGFDTAAPGFGFNNTPDLVDGSDSGSSSRDNYTNVTKPTFSGEQGSAEAGATLRLYDNDATLIGTTTVQADGSWTATSDQVLANGPHDITARLSDAAGNESGPSQSLRITVDTVAPRAPLAPDLAYTTDSGKSAGDNITNAETVTINGTFDNAEASTRVSLYDTDGTTLLGSASAGMDGSWSVNLSLSEGTHVLTAKSTDAAGNVGTVSPGLTVVVDRTAPAAPNAPLMATASDSGISNSDGITKLATPRFTGAAGSVEGGATVNLYDTNGATVIATTTAAADGSWSVASAALAEGVHTITAKAVDVAGNIGAASTGATVVIDRTAPVTQATGVAFSNDTGSSTTDLITRSAEQIITGTLSAVLAADERVEVSLDNGNSWRSASVDGTGWSLLATLGGSNTLQVRVSDAAGNAGTAYTKAYVLDTTAPAAPSTPDLDAASDTGTSGEDDITGATTPTFSGSAEAGATVTLYDGDIAIGSGVVADGIWHITSDTVLGQGSHNITARATDLAGNQGAASAALTIQVITDAPTTKTIAMQFSADSGASATDLVTKVASQTLAGTLDAELAAGEYVEVSVNGGAWQTANADGADWYLAATLDSGTHPIAVRVTNAIGNSSEPYVRDYTLDTVAPGVTIESSASQLKAYETATITFTFSEDPGATFTWDGNAGDVVVRGGTLSPLEGTGAVRTAIFTPDAGTNDGSASITIEAGAYADLAGNAGSAGTTPSLHFDTLIPVVPSVPVLAAGSDTGVSSTDNLTANNRPTFTGTAESGTTVTLHNSKGATIGSGTAVDGVWSITPISPLPNGVQTIVARAYDAAGNISAFSGKQTITIDKTPPTLAITSDVAQLKIGETAILTFTFSEDPGSSFMRSDVVVEGGTIGALSGTGLTRMAVFTPAGGVDGGTASITVAAGSYGDVVGNAGGAGATPVLRFDTKAPVAPSTPDLIEASDTGASSTDNITADTMPTFSGTAEDGARVTLYDGATAIGSATAVDGMWRITSEVALQKGTHAITAIALDAAGNASPASGVLTFDLLTGGPATTVSGVALSSDSGVSDTDLVTRVVEQTISGALSATLASGEHVEVSIDGGQNWVTAAAAAGDGDWTLSTMLLSGTHEIQVKVVDAVGNSGPVLTQAYTLDTIAPGLAISSDVAQLKAGETATVTFTFSEDPGSTFTRADVQVEGGTLGALSGSGLTRTATFIPAAGIDGGVASITVNAGLYTDKAGNAGGAGTTPVLHFDTLAPAAPSAPVLAAGSDTGVSATDAITAGDQPTFTGTAESGTEVTLYDEQGRAIGSGTAVDGVWSIAPTTALADGAHTIIAKALDAAGNASAAGDALTVTIDTSAPTLVITSDVAQLKAGETALITFTFSEDPGAGFDAASIGVEGGTLGALRGSGLTRTAVFTPTAGIDGGTAGIRVNGGAYTDIAGNAGGVGLPPALSFDTLAPQAPSAPALAAASDTGSAGDGITTSTSQVIEGAGDAFALVTLYDGERKVDTVTADASGKWSIAASLATGSHALSVTQADAAGNVSVHSEAFALTVETAPEPTPLPDPTPAPDTLVDGMPVETQPVTLPGGVAGTTISVPVVTGSRSETAGAAGVADIPLATSGSANLLLAQLPAGYGLSASGANVGVTGGIEFLIASIKAATPTHAANDQQHLTGNGQSFLAQLAATDSLLVQTVKPVSTAAPDAALVLSGEGAPAGQNVALVIDTGGLAAGSKLMLQQVDFAAIVGAADVRVGSAGTILSGDAASQHFTVTAGDAGALFSGGGNDVLTFARSQAAQAGSASGHASAAAVAASGVSLLHGGLAGDTAAFTGARSDYQVEQHNGYTVVSSLATPDAKALVVNVEQLQFSDGSVAVEQNAAQDIIAGMYQTVLGRQADLYGFEYWADLHDAGESWGAIALHMIDSAEHNAGTGSFDGNNAHDIALLYQALFNRAPEAAGLAYWQDQMAQGATLAQVADSLVGSAEMVGHQRLATDWDFLV